LAWWDTFENTSRPRSPPVVLSTTTQNGGLCGVDGLRAHSTSLAHSGSIIVLTREKRELPVGACCKCPQHHSRTTYIPAGDFDLSISQELMGGDFSRCLNLSVGA